MRIEHVNENSLIIYFENKISQEVSNKVKSLYIKLKELTHISELVCSYNSILLEYDILFYDYKKIEDVVKDIILMLDDNLSKEEKQIIKIPVLYSGEFGLDLQKVSNDLNLSIEEIIKLHTSKIYDVYALGFMAGFAYLGELENRLFTNRLKNPRKSIPKGSVAIANNQTAVYPQNSPGGWNIIGRTPIEMFSKDYDNYSYIQLTHLVQFYSISEVEFVELGGVL